MCVIYARHFYAANIFTIFSAAEPPLAICAVGGKSGWREADASARRPPRTTPDDGKPFEVNPMAT